MQEPWTWGTRNGLGYVLTHIDYTFASSTVTGTCNPLSNVQRDHRPLKGQFVLPSPLPRLIAKPSMNGWAPLNQEATDRYQLLMLYGCARRFPEYTSTFAATHRVYHHLSGQITGSHMATELYYIPTLSHEAHCYGGVPFYYEDKGPTSRQEIQRNQLETHEKRRVGGPNRCRNLFSYTVSKREKQKGKHTGPESCR